MNQTSRDRSGAGLGVLRTRGLALAIAAVSVASLAVLSEPVSAGGAVVPAPAPPPPAVEPIPAPEGLKGIPVPMPANIFEYVTDLNAAARMGKALFWDMQVGSDGKTACASCHFRAGADTRSKNQVSPGLNRRSDPNTPNPDFTFQVGGPNYQFKAADFPFHKFSDPGNRNSTVLSTHNDVASSQGVFNSTFVSANRGASADTVTYPGDPVFNIAGKQTRKVEPRNTPSMINSIFNFRNFWDGRATYLFNGATPFGAMDDAARVYKTNPGTFTAVPVQIRIEKASLASLATGPALSDFEMSGAGRTWPEIGFRLLPARALVQQQVSPTDSSLAVVRHTTGVGLSQTYQDMVRAAFRQEWWAGTNLITIGGKTYTQTEANFSLFFGLAIQAYGATLVSDDSPFDRHMVGDSTAMTTDAKLGMAIFHSAKGKCSSCHVGAEFTGASTRRILRDGPMSRMVMGDGNTAVYDEGFYNISIAKTLDDIANGANNPVGRPMSSSKLAQQVGSNEFQRLIGVPANVVVAPGERIAVNGAFKTPGLRNVELTAPYFHNGSVLTLEQVVEFYNRGGNHFQNNIADVDADIQPLGLTVDERRQLVAFLKSLTDNRVRYDRAPFDHPQLVIANGHGAADGSPLLPDVTLNIPAVGREGYAATPVNFLENTSVYFQLVPAHATTKCVETVNRGESQGNNVAQWACNGGDHQKWEEVPVATGGFMLRNRLSGRCMDVSGISYAVGANIYQWECLGTPNQTFTWVGTGTSRNLRVQHSNQCVSVIGGAGDGANVVQWTCSTATNLMFAKRP